MARSAAELKAMVAEANQLLHEADALVRLATDKAQQAATRYRSISDKLVSSATAANMAEDAANQFLAHTSRAKAEAEYYSAPL